MEIHSSVKLNNGVATPVIGLGTWSLSPGRETLRAVQEALALGYRLIDTASMYGNEQSVGDAVRQSQLARSDVFVTTKLWNTDHGYDRTLAAIDASLRRLGFDYVDLYLIHWPQDRLRQETWRAMEDALEQGKARAVGVSNYGVREMEEVLAHGRIVPAVNQIELTPYSYARQRKVIELCRTQDILLQSYSPLTKGRRLDDLWLRRIADKYGKTPAQILLRWNLEHGFVPLPKSSNPDHQRANVGIFDFSLVEEDMAVLDRLG